MNKKEFVGIFFSKKTICKYDKKINLEKEIEQIFNLFGRYETIIDTCFQNKKICDETITKLEMCVNLILYNLYEISVKLYVPK